MLRKFLMIVCFCLISNSIQAMDFLLFKQENVALQLPSDWKSLSSQEIQVIKDKAKSFTGRKSTSRTLLELRSDDGQIGGKIRLSILPLAEDQLGVEEELKNLSVSEEKEFTFELTSMQKAEFKRVNALARELNVSLVRNNEKMAILTSYIRPSNPSTEWKVNQYKFPDSVNKREILLTLSYRLEDEKRIKPVLDKVLSSLTF